MFLKKRDKLSKLNLIEILLICIERDLKHVEEFMYSSRHITRLIFIKLHVYIGVGYTIEDCSLLVKFDSWF